jgi:hypothetical protein
MASIFRRIVVAALLAAWSFPAMAAAPGAEPAPIVETTHSARTAAASSEAAQYAAREQEAPANQNFQGGAYIYIGGGVLAVALIVLLILVIL